MDKQDKLVNEEICDKDLDSVAGGTYEETKADFKALFKMGLITENTYDEKIRDLVGMGVEAEFWFRRAGVKYEWDGRDYKHNTYSYNGKEITRQEALDIVYKWKWS